MKCLLVLDTFAHSKNDGVWHIERESLTEAKATLKQLIKTGSVTFDYNGDPEKSHLIYCALIHKIDKEGNATYYLRSDDGIKWNKYNVGEKAYSGKGFEAKMVCLFGEEI